MHITTPFEVEGFADDNQLLKKFIVSFQTEILGFTINECLQSISTWMNKFCLKLNKDKTKILVFAPPAIMDSIRIHGTFVDGECVRFVDCAKNLGIWLDECLNFKQQINKVVSSCFMIIKELARLKSFITKEHLISLVVALIFSKLDYCNALYYNIPANELNHLQSVQNACVRLVCGGRKFDQQPISHRFIELHWLKVRERVIYKILMTVHKCVWGVAPKSLANKIMVANPRTFKLAEMKKNGAFGERTFSRAGPKLWNCLPTKFRVNGNMEQFKKLMKSHLLINSHEFYALLNMV